MKIDWQKEIHSGWRRSLGVFCITAGLVAAFFYYGQYYLLQKSSNHTQSAVASSSPVAPSVKASNVPTTPQITATITQGKIHIKTASETELESLPKIGPAKAKAIIDYRTTHDIQSVDELDQVKGIGPSILNQIKPLIDLE